MVLRSKTRMRMEKTPLHEAARKGNHEAARLLIAAGADPNAISQRGTPLDVLFSQMGGSRDVKTYDILVKTGAKIINATVLKTCPNGHQTLTNVPVVAGFATGAEGRKNVNNFISWPGGCTRGHPGEIVIRCTTCRYTFDPLFHEWFIPSPNNEFDWINRKKISK